MKKGSLLLLLILLVQGMKAQQTRIEIQSFYAIKFQIFIRNNPTGAADEWQTYSGPTFWLSDLRFSDGVSDIEFELIDSQQSDVLKTYRLRLLPQKIEEVLVRATRATEKEPFAKEEVKRDVLEVQNTGRDLPIMLQNQTSVITTSDAGNGVGYTGIRVRGSDASRTNITVNGVPINDAESQGTFWVNMPDLASSVQSIQIQRGAGSSTNGAGAFGATVNIQTATGFKPYGQISNSIGSYNTMKNTLAAGTGLINGHWTMDMRLSRISSDGYIDRATSNLNSYFISTGYFASKWSIKFLHFSGSEHTYQAWNGIPREKLYGTDSALQNHYWRNVGYQYRNSNDSMNLFNSNQRTYNYYTYDNETDNYKQAHYHLYFNYALKPGSDINVTLYRTNGAGYFEQWRPLDKLSNYGMPNTIIGNDTITNSDIIRRRWLDNTLTGINAAYHLQQKRFNLTVGGAFSAYRGNHYGEIVWARIAPSSEYLKHYYEATGDKNDANVFAKMNLEIQKNFHVFLDMQVRNVTHEGYGMDNDLRDIRFSKSYLFFNPKAGLNYETKKSGLFYLSAAMANKEPARSDFTDNALNQSPLPESMLDMEAGWNFGKTKWNSSLNVYWMQYANQLVPTGAVNDVGTPLRTNVKNSYRAGIEWSGKYQITSNFAVAGNITLSQNRIKEFTMQTMDYYDYSVKDTVLKNKPIAYSPAAISAVSFQYRLPGNYIVTLNNKYVGKQYLDNSGDEDKIIKAYYFSELWLNKRWNFKSWYLDAKVQVNNISSYLYNNNGYTYEYKYQGSLTREVFLFPSAPRNFMAGLTIGF